jgi:NhaP-type Na+/H+ or K+/H+ antiporter
LIGCGVLQKRYASRNISKKSLTTVKYATKTLAAFSDCIIFLFLGFVTVKPDHTWHTGFTLWTCVFCGIFRFASVFFLSAIINRTRIKPISIKEQFIMSYGGLRGAVGFSLAQILDDQNPFKQMFLTTTIFMVFFTVFIQGGTIKFLVNKLKITKHEEGVSDQKFYRSSLNKNREEYHEYRSCKEHLLERILVIQNLCQ